ncbi:PAS domain-containing protein [[Mycobacterium] burgundiense]|jgi:PAS domain S-box-containing protein|uniref:PAS domain S-box protein n=1 Tax=[Mycobacterium] burgundiense TaxID=3064286 RepID=A0ABM9LEK4_9MYCO|nr:PAS domain S-box protein [Mycolicibacterium sp. MU0053]CAJ1497643.1 PAS domain S-box protein [Mycolicibacterium sp. MU0053]
MDEKMIAAALLSGPDAVMAADRNGLITFWNGGAERIFGFAAEQAVGESLDLIIPKRHRARHWAGWHRVMETGQSRYSDGDLLAVPAVRADGSAISVEFVIHPVTDGQQHLLGIAATLRDVTARFEETRDLRRQLAER